MTAPSHAAVLMHVYQSALDNHRRHTCTRTRARVHIALPPALLRSHEPHHVQPHGNHPRLLPLLLSYYY